MDARRPLALVVEGGGMRGAYAAGAVLEVIDQVGPRLGGIYATSSGASTSAYAASDQREGLDIWKDHLHGRRLVRPDRLLLGRSPLDVSYLIDTVFGKRVPLDLDAVRRFPGPFEATATRADTGDAAYFDLRTSDILPVLKAAVSLPGAVREPVMMDGVPYVDGGLVDPIPVRRALDQGFRDIVLVLTRPHGYRKGPVKRIGRWLVTRDFPGLAAAVARQHERYNAAADVVEHPPTGVRFTVIQPSPNLDLARWTTSRRKLLRAIEEGIADARRALAPMNIPRSHES